MTGYRPEVVEPCFDRAPGQAVRRGVSRQSRAHPLFGLPTLDGVTPRVDLKKRSSCDAAPMTLQKQSRARSPRRSPLDVFGESAVNTRDHFGHLTASLMNHMTAKQQKDSGVQAALRELAETAARDMAKMVEHSWQNGVAHGQWLKDAESRRNAEEAASAVAAKAELFKLQLNNQTLLNQLRLALARVKELDPLTGSASDEISMEELQSHLDDMLATNPACLLEDDDPVSAVLADIGQHL